MNSYLVKTMIILYYFTCFLYTSYNLSSILQLFSVFFLYIKILTSFTNFMTLILSFNRIRYLIKLTLKKKYKMNDIDDFCDIFACIIQVLLLQSFIMIKIFLFFKKLKTQSIIYVNIRFFRKLCNNSKCDTLLNTLILFRYNKLIM